MTTPEASVEAEDELSSAERKLLAAAAAGKFLTLRNGSIELNNELHDPAAGPAVVAVVTGVLKRN